jgi:sugar lactone lactonase YvrE
MMPKGRRSAESAAIAALLALAALSLLNRPAAQPPPDVERGNPRGSPQPTTEYVVGRRDIRVETLAGEVPGYRDGPGWLARFCGPNALALAPDGSLLVCDSRNHRLRHITPDGTVSTAAGGGQAGGSGGRADGPALQAQFRYPSGVAVARDGTIYVADTGNHRICRLRAGHVSTFAGGTPGYAEGTGAAARFRFPGPLALARDGSLWVADVGNRRLRQVDPAGAVTTPGHAATGVDVMLGEFRAPRHRQITGSGDGLAQIWQTSLTMGRRSPGATWSTGLAPGERRRHAALEVFADPDHHVIMTRYPSDAPMLAAGRRQSGADLPGSRDGTGDNAGFVTPCAVAVSSEGVVYVADYDGNRIRRLLLPEWMLEGQPVPPQDGRQPGKP